MYIKLKPEKLSILRSKEEAKRRKRVKMMEDKEMIEREINKRRNMDSSVLFGYDTNLVKSNYLKK